MTKGDKVRLTRPMLRTLCAAVALSLLVACGSALSEQELLARSGQQVACGGGAAQGGASPTTLTGGASANPSGGGSVGDVGPSAAATADGAGSGIADAGTADGGASSAAVSCKDSSTAPIVLGNYGDYSGPAGASTADIPTGVKIWAASVNARGGLCGRPVQILSADAAGDPARAASIVREQVEQDKAIAFVSDSALTSGTGGNPYLIQNRIPAIGDSLADEASRTAATIMATSASIQETGLGSLHAAMQIAGSNAFGMMYCTESSQCSDIKTGFKGKAAEAGANWVWDASVSLLQVDYTAECQNAQKAGVQVLVLMMDAASILRIVRSCNRQGFHPAYALIGNAIGANTTQEPGFESAIILSLTFPFAGASSPAIDEYEQARQRYAPDRPSNGGMGSGWAAAKLFELIATRAAQMSGTISSESIAAAMQTVQNETVGGLTVPLTWGAHGSTGLPCIFAVQGDGHGGYITPAGVAPIC